MSLAEKVGTGEVVTLDPASLKPGPKVRKDRIDLDNVAALEPVIESCPPITVNHPSLMIVDGHHRQAAAVRRRVGIRAVLVSLTPAEMFEQAVHANVTHGLALTKAERKSNVTKMVKDCPEWSDRRIAEACGVDHKTVADTRKRPSGERPQLDTKGKREGADGRRRPANPTAQRQGVRTAIAADPEASDRSIAQKTGVSPTTVGTQRRRLAALPDVAEDSPPTVGELIVLAPVVWKDEPACQRSNATREFGLFMDHFTRRKGKSFYDLVTAMADECPADLTQEADSVARSMAAAWTRLADSVGKPKLSEAK